jgi:hypothetical protein
MIEPALNVPESMTHHEHAKTRSQRAMLVAKASPEPEQGHRGKKAVDTEKGQHIENLVLNCRSRGIR